MWSSIPGNAGTGTANTISASVSAARVNTVGNSVSASNPSARASATPRIDRL